MYSLPLSERSTFFMHINLISKYLFHTDSFSLCYQRKYLDVILMCCAKEKMLMCQIL